MRWLAWGSWNNFQSHMISNRQGLSSNADLSASRSTHGLFTTLCFPIFLNGQLQYCHVTRDSFHAGIFCFLNSEFWSGCPTARDLCERPRDQRWNCGGCVYSQELSVRSARRSLETIFPGGIASITYGKTIDTQGPESVPFRWHEAMSN